MATINELIKDVETARAKYLDKIAAVTEQQARWQPDEATWNIIANTEHLYWAEQGSIVGMWKTLHAIREGSMPRTYESIYKDMPILQVIELTWKEKEVVPPIAAPRFGGPLSFWKLSLHGLQELLEAFAKDLQENELRLQAHPHPISGPLDFHQRLEFLRFHIERHSSQVERLLDAMRSS